MTVKLERKLRYRHLYIEIETKGWRDTEIHTERDIETHSYKKLEVWTPKDMQIERNTEVKQKAKNKGIR